MGGGIGASANLDVWVVVGLIVVGVLVLVWRARPAGEQPPSEDTPELSALDAPAQLEAAADGDLEHVNRDRPESGDERHQDHAA